MVNARWFLVAAVGLMTACFSSSDFDATPEGSSARASGCVSLSSLCGALSGACVGLSASCFSIAAANVEATCLSEATTIATGCGTGGAGGTSVGSMGGTATDPCASCETAVASSDCASESAPCTTAGATCTLLLQCYDGCSNDTCRATCRSTYVAGLPVYGRAKECEFERCASSCPGKSGVVAAVTSADACGSVVAFLPSEATSGFCTAACAVDEDCVWGSSAGRCLEDPSIMEKQCYPACRSDADCGSLGAGWICQRASSSSGVVEDYCAFPTGLLGAAHCSDGAQCASGMCSSAGYCLSTCSTVADCDPHGSACVLVEGGAQYCVPTCESDGSCALYGSSLTCVPNGDDVICENND